MLTAEFVCCFPADAAFFAGHFPGRPIVPGVLLLDQAILYAEACQGGGARRWQIAQAKFFRPVAPDEKVHYQLRESRGAWAFTARVDGAEVASGRLQAAA
ncbi:MAG TPA: hypothetical protein PKY22_10735 [Accumulibacter sp.]|nr:hypothetical protein [Accumulibacter sp.]